MSCFETKTRSAIVGLMLLVVAGSFVPKFAYATGLPVFDAADVGVNTANGVILTANGVTLSTIATTLQARKGPLGSGVGLDSIAWTVAKMAIQMMVKSTVNWINSGFQGSPAFVTNPTAFLLQVSDVAANAFLQQLASNGSLHSPFQASVAQSVSNNYYLSTSGSGGFFTSAAYTLNKLVPNDSAFLGGNFSQGGWSGWFSAATHPQNNPYGAQIVAASALAQQVANAQNTKSQQLNWGQGFLSWCGNATGGGGGTSGGGSCKTDDDCAGALACISGKCSVDKSLDGNSATTCTNKDGSTGNIQTPGSVIQSQINKTLGLSGDTLVTADEFNEVIGALLSQLVNQVLGGTGLLGVGSVSAGGNGYIDQATSPTAQMNALNASQTEGTFVDGINSTITQVQQYQSDVQSLENEALLAKQALASGTSKKACTTGEQIVSQTLTTSESQLAATASAITQLGQIQNDATNAIITGTVVTGSSATPAGASATITNAENEYQTFVQSPAMPSASEMSFVHAQAQDNSASQTQSSPAPGTKGSGNATSSSPPPTLMTTLEEIAAGMCPS